MYETDFLKGKPATTAANSVDTGVRRELGRVDGQEGAAEAREARHGSQVGEIVVDQGLHSAWPRRPSRTLHGHGRSGQCSQVSLEIARLLLVQQAHGQFVSQCN